MAVPLVHKESYLTSRASGRVEWSRMISEERFCGEMVVQVPSVRKETKARELQGRVSLQPRR